MVALAPCTIPRVHSYDITVPNLPASTGPPLCVPDRPASRARDDLPTAPALQRARSRKCRLYWRTWSRNPMPVDTSIACLTPGAWSRVRVHEMDVSDVSRETVAVRIGLSVEVDMVEQVGCGARARSSRGSFRRRRLCRSPTLNNFERFDFSCAAAAAFAVYPVPIPAARCPSRRSTRRLGWLTLPYANLPPVLAPAADSGGAVRRKPSSSSERANRSQTTQPTPHLQQRVLLPLILDKYSANLRPTLQQSLCPPSLSSQLETQPLPSPVAPSPSRLSSSNPTTTLPPSAPSPSPKSSFSSPTTPPSSPNIASKSLAPSSAASRTPSRAFGPAGGRFLRSCLALRSRREAALEGVVAGSC